MVKLFSFLSLFLVLGLNPEPQVSSEAIDYMKKCTEAIRKVKTVRYTMTKRERVEGQIQEQSVDVKLNVNPYKVYMKQRYPKVGMEILYPYGEHQKALINPNGFPWVSIALDPMGHKMRDGQHHNVMRSGFAFTGKVIEALMKDSSGLVTNVEYLGMVKVDGITYRKILVETNFYFFDYTVQDEKNITEVAAKFHVNDFVILENNKDVHHHDQIEKGQVIKVPSTYAKKMELYLGKDNLLPLNIKIYDHKGLFEHYTFRDVKVNVEIKPEEFSREYKDYDF